MADVITTNFSHTYSGAETNEILLKPVFQNPELREFFRIMPRVKGKTNLYTTDVLEKITRKYSTCGWNPVGSIAITDRTIEPAKVKVNLEQCIEEFAGTYWEETFKAGTQVNDLTGTPIGDMLVQRTRDGIARDLHRISWFAKSDAASADYNHLDGWFQNMIGVSPNVDIAADAPGGVLATDAAISVFERMLTAQSEALRGLPSADKVFFVTSTLFDNYKASLRNGSNNLNTEIMINGRGRYSFDGIVIEPVYTWDRFKGDADNPYSTILGDHFAVLSQKGDNLTIATDVVTPGEDTKMWLDDKTELFHLKAKWKMDAKVMWTDMVVTAYAEAEEEG